MEQLSLIVLWCDLFYDNHLPSLIERYRLLHSSLQGLLWHFRLTDSLSLLSVFWCVTCMLIQRSLRTIDALGSRR